MISLVYWMYSKFKITSIQIIDADVTLINEILFVVTNMKGLRILITESRMINRITLVNKIVAWL